jgi:hypothetical protein
MMLEKSALRALQMLGLKSTINLPNFWSYNTVIAPNAISQLQIIVHFYDSDGNIVGLSQAFTTPSKLIPMRTAIFNIKQSPSELTGAPKIFRVYYEFVG